MGTDVLRHDDAQALVTRWFVRLLRLTGVTEPMFDLGNHLDNARGPSVPIGVICGIDNLPRKTGTSSHPYNEIGFFEIL